MKSDRIDSYIENFEESVREVIVEKVNINEGEETQSRLEKYTGRGGYAQPIGVYVFTCNDCSKIRQSKIHANVFFTCNIILYIFRHMCMCAKTNQNLSPYIAFILNSPIFKVL